MRAVVAAEPERVHPLVREVQEEVAPEAWLRFVQLMELPIWAGVVEVVDTVL
jgi:hypothetical protein